MNIFIYICIVYMLYTGKPPHGNRNPNFLVAWFPGGLIGWLGG